MSTLEICNEIVHSTLHFWTKSTAVCAFCSAPRKGLICCFLAVGSCCKNPYIENNAEMLSSGRLFARLLM